MTASDRAETLRDTAIESPDDADIGVLGDCLRGGNDGERIAGAEALARLALAGRDVSAVVDAVELESWDDALFEASVWLHPGADDEAISPRAVAFAVCSLVVTDHVDPDVLPRLLGIHERRYPEFDPDARGYTAVREVGWALASTVIASDDHVDDLIALGDHEAEAVRRIAAAGLSDVAEEYHAVHGHAAPGWDELLAHAAELLGESDDERVRYHAAFSLYEFALEQPTRVRERTALLRTALDDEYDLVRKEAAGVLGVVGAAAARDDLSRLAASDPAEAVREAAARALERIENG